MKFLFILFVAAFATFPAFAQKAKNGSPERSTLVQVQYVCPMHPEMVSDKPGTCPKCHMDLTKKEQMKADVTKHYTCPVHKEVVSDHAGICPKCKAQLVVDRKGSKQVTKTYTCSMHPNEVSTKPGKCPVCGMDMMEAKATTKKS